MLNNTVAFQRKYINAVRLAQLPLMRRFISGGVRAIHEQSPVAAQQMLAVDVIEHRPMIIKCAVHQRRQRRYTLGIIMWTAGTQKTIKPRHQLR